MKFLHEAGDGYEVWRLSRAVKEFASEVALVLNIVWICDEHPMMTFLFRLCCRIGQGFRVVTSLVHRPNWRPE